MTELLTPLLNRVEQFLERFRMDMSEFGPVITEVKGEYCEIRN